MRDKTPTPGRALPADGDAEEKGPRWQFVVRNDTSRTHRLPVPGGWLYRVDRLGPGGVKPGQPWVPPDVVGSDLCFVPTPSEESDLRKRVEQAIPLAQQVAELEARVAANPSHCEDAVAVASATGFYILRLLKDPP